MTLKGSGVIIPQNVNPVALVCEGGVSILLGRTTTNEGIRYTD